MNLEEVIDKTIRRGVGELLISSIDNDGSGMGYNEYILDNIPNNIPIEVIINSGAVESSHFVEALKNDKLDASITNIDKENYKVSLSIRVMEEEIEKEAMEKYGSKDSGASLGAILGKALGREKKEE